MKPPTIGIGGTVIVALICLVLGSVYERQRVARDCAERGSFKRGSVMYVCTVMP